MIFVSIVKLIVKVGNAINFPVKKLYTYVVKTQTKKNSNNNLSDEDAFRFKNSSSCICLVNLHKKCRCFLCRKWQLAIVPNVQCSQLVPKYVKRPSSGGYAASKKVRSQMWSVILQDKRSSSGQLDKGHNHVHLTVRLGFVNQHLWLEILGNVTELFG